MRFRICVIALLLAATACSGPRRPIELAVQEFPGDVSLGKKTTIPSPTTQPSGVNPAPIGFPPFLQPPPPLRTVGAAAPSGPTSTVKPPTTKVACKPGDPITPPKKEATKNVAGPPEPQGLTYRNNGTFEATSRDGTVERGNFIPLSARAITTRPLGDGTFEYVVTERTGPTQTATTYFLDPANGLYLVGVATTLSDGSVDRFQSARRDALLLLPLPVTLDAQVGGAAVDPQSASNFSFLGKVVGKTRVDACGVPLDAWEVQVTEGRITGPNKQVRFIANYAIGTQYGALSLRDTVEFACDEQVNAFCDNGRKVVTKNTAVVASEPKVVGAR